LGFVPQPNLRRSAFHPGSASSPSHLRDLLSEALRADPSDPQSPPPPLGFLQPALHLVDDRLITLLSALGPQALARDPGLALKLRHRGPLPALIICFGH